MIKLPELNYAYDALEHYIDAKTMEIHHSKHHQAYINNFIKAVEKMGENPDNYDDEKVKDMIKNLDSLNVDESIKTAIRNNGGGHINHDFFWKIMAPDKGGKPTGELARLIDEKFGSFEKFQEEFEAAAAGRFGSGWAWLVKDESGKLEVMSTPNQDSPLSQGKKPVIGVDVWEHAYYLKYQNKRPDYLKQFWNVVNWDEAQNCFDRE